MTTTSYSGEAEEKHRRDDKEIWVAQMEDNRGRLTAAALEAQDKNATRRDDNDSMSDRQRRCRERVSDALMWLLL
jgi:hypothetical protein